MDTTTDTKTKGRRGVVLQRLLLRHGACADARDWAQGKTLPEAWATCERADWMLWLAAKALPRERAVLAACECARTVLKYVRVGENRPRIAIETAERWARGEATLDDVLAARSAAYAAAAASDAAAAAYAAAYASDAAAYAASAAAAAAASDAAAAAYAAADASAAAAAASDAYAAAYAAAYASDAAAAAYASAAAAADASAAAAAYASAARSQALRGMANIVRGLIRAEELTL